MARSYLVSIKAQFVFIAGNAIGCSVWVIGVQRTQSAVGVVVALPSAIDFNPCAMSGSHLVCQPAADGIIIAFGGTRGAARAVRVQTLRVTALKVARAHLQTHGVDQRPAEARSGRTSSW